MEAQAAHHQVISGGKATFQRTAIPLRRAAEARSTWPLGVAPPPLNRSFKETSLWAKRSADVQGTRMGRTHTTVVSTTPRCSGYMLTLPPHSPCSSFPGDINWAFFTLLESDHKLQLVACGESPLAPRGAALSLTSRLGEGSRGVDEMEGKWDAEKVLWVLVRAGDGGERVAVLINWVRCGWWMWKDWGRRDADCAVGFVMVGIRLVIMCQSGRGMELR